MWSYLFFPIKEGTFSLLGEFRFLKGVTCLLFTVCTRKSERHISVIFFPFSLTRRQFSTCFHLICKQQLLVTMFGKQVLTKTSLQIKDIPFVTFCTGMHIRVIDGIWVEFSLVCYSLWMTQLLGEHGTDCVTPISTEDQGSKCLPQMLPSHHLNKLALSLT